VYRSRSVDLPFLSRTAGPQTENHRQHNFNYVRGLGSVSIEVADKRGAHHVFGSGLEFH
jgi:hypothetical protein